jgi:hypothetical protein
MTRGPFDGKHGPPHPSSLRKGDEGHTNKSKSSPRSPPHGIGGSSHGYTLWMCLKKPRSPSEVVSELSRLKQTLHRLAARCKNLARVCTLLQGFGGYTHGCASAPPRNVTHIQRGRKPYQKLQPLRYPLIIPAKARGLLSGTAIGGPLTMGEITLSKK